MYYIDIKKRLTSQKITAQLPFPTTTNNHPVHILSPFLQTSPSIKDLKYEIHIIKRVVVFLKCLPLFGLFVEPLFYRSLFAICEFNGTDRCIRRLRLMILIQWRAIWSACEWGGSRSNKMSVRPPSTLEIL